MSVFGNGVFVQTGGTDIVSESMTISDGGLVSQSGGVTIIGAELQMEGGPPYPAATYALNGGVLILPAFLPLGGTTTVFDFNGGTLQPSGPNSAFVAGLATANVQVGGAIINPNGYSIGISQDVYKRQHTTISPRPAP